MFTNKEKSGASFLRRPVAIAAMVGLTATMAIGIGVSSASAVGTSTNVSVALSNNQSTATGVTYTAQFTNATTDVIKTVGIFIGVTATAESPGVGTVYGLGAGTVTYVPATGFLVYTVTTPVSVSAGTPIYIETTGLSNVGMPATTTPQINTANAAPSNVDLGTGPAFTIGGTNTAATLQVAKSLSFTNDTPAYTLLMDPSLPALADAQKAINLSVKTNAGQGYTISVKDLGLKNAGTGAGAYTIPASASNVTAAAFAANTFGGWVSGSSSANSLLTTATAYGSYTGYTTAGATVVTATKPTGNTADTIAMLNRVKIDYTTPAGTYTDTITYTATPAY